MLCLHLQLLVDEPDREIEARVGWNDIHGTYTCLSTTVTQPLQTVETEFRRLC